MKFKQKLKKGWSILETVLVLAVTAILAGVSVGIYFGVTTQDPETAAVTIQQQVVDLWESHINNGTEFSSDIEAKAREFCTGYIEERGTNVPLNYRVLEFDTYVSAIPNESETSRAYDPSGNAKEAVIIKIDSFYPSYFISTASSVLKLSPVFETETLLNQAVINDNYVSYSGVLDDYGITSADDDFSLFYELTDINYNGEIVRGIKYVRYNVLNANNEVYATVFGRANRSLDGDCEGEYLPKSFAITMGNSIFHTSTFRLIETKGEEKYNYDPDHIYEYGDTYLEGRETYQVFEGKDANGNDIVTNKVAPISVVNDEYITGEKTINFYPTLTTGNGDKEENGGTGNEDNEEEPNIDIYTPLDPEDVPTVPGTGTGPGDVTIEPDADIEVYPITLAFADYITYTNLADSIIAWFKSWFGIREFKFKYLYFTNLDALNEFINTPTYGKLLTSIEDPSNRISYLHFANGFEIDTFLSIPKDFVVFVDDVKDNTAKERTDHIDEFIKTYKKNKGNTQMMDNRVWGNQACDPYKVHWPEAPEKLIHITESGILKLTDASKLYVESDAGVSSWNYNNAPYGWKVKSYGEIDNDGLIQLLTGSSARITGLISGSGRITVSNGASISEPLKFTDYLGNQNSSGTYINRNIFPSDCYYLDSIRCNLVLNWGATYTGLVALHTKPKMTDDHTFFGNINIISDKAGESIFVMTRDESQVVKTCDDNGKTTIDVVDGDLTYSYDELVTSTSSGLLIDYLANGYDAINTKKTGFKLSNINLLVRKGASFSMPSSEYDNNYKENDNTEYKNEYYKLEVLPSAKLHVFNGGRLNMGKNSFIYIANYFESGATMFNYSGSSKSAYSTIMDELDNDTIFDALLGYDFRPLLINKMKALKTIYDASTSNGKTPEPMFVMEGTVNYITDSSTFSRKSTNSSTSCTKKSDRGSSCRYSVPVSETKYEPFISGAIFAFTSARINGYKGYLGTFSNKSVVETTRTHEHSFWLGEDSFDYTFRTYTKTYNVVTYGFGGDYSCWAYPSMILSF